MKLKFLTLPVIAFVVMLSTLVALPQQAKAVSAADWKAGRIIDDDIFFNKNAMSVPQIQSFLNAKVPVCDTYHNWSGWSYGYWNAPPYTCLKDYSENGKSSAQIIWEAGQAYDINPQVLLVLLQKETAIVTDPWAAPWQYKRAVGYKCPDSALGLDVDANQNGCYDSHENFTAQVSGAAFRFRDYVNYPNYYNFKAGVTRNILWSDKNCGSSPVYIENAATAALYNYTPYQPNQAALNNMYGVGDGCSAYGNRNFWRMFNDWFGSTIAPNSSIQLMSSLNISNNLYIVGNSVTASFRVKNTASYTVDAGGLGICARLNGNNFDFGYSGGYILNSGQEITISHSRVITNPGDLKIFICSYHDSLGGWANERYPYDFNGAFSRSINVQIFDNPLITSGINITPSSPTKDQPVTASVTMQNFSDNPVNIGLFVVAVRDENGNNLDFVPDYSVTIPARSTYTYTKTQTFRTTGNLSFFVANYNNGTWNNNLPRSQTDSIKRSLVVNVKDNPLITSGINISPSSPSKDQPVTASVTMQNFSDNPVSLGLFVVAARDENGNNLDFIPDYSVTIPARGTYTYSKTQTFRTTGNLSFFVANYNNGTWNNNLPRSQTDSIKRSLVVNVKDNPLITSGINITPSSPTKDQPVTASVTMQNFSDNPVNIGLFVVAVRDENGNNLDFVPDYSVTIPARSTYTYTKTQTFRTTGNLSFFVANYNNGTWNNNLPRSQTDSIKRSLVVNVK